jgi:predicted amidohydrolase
MSLPSAVAGNILMPAEACMYSIKLSNFFSQGPVMIIPTNCWRSRLFHSVFAIAAGALLTHPVSSAAQPPAVNPTAPEERKVRIAVVQQETQPGNVEANRSKAIEFAREAVSHGADVILFHEALLVGYVPHIHELAEPADGPSTRAFQQLLQGTDSVIVYGLIERDGDNFYTSAIIVAADKIRACYRKTHLWWRSEGVRHEPTYFRPGNSLVTFDVKGHKTGVMICYDGDFPEMTRAYANLGCTILLWLNNRGSRGPAEVAPLVRANTIIMATACCCGENEAGTACGGGSNITDKNGATRAVIWNEEGIIYADVDPDSVAAAREQNPWFRGQRQDLYRQLPK